MSDIISIPLNKLVRSPRNVRKTGGESVEELAASIHAHGLLHNLTVTEHQNQKGAKSGKYEVIAGDRRFRALERLASEKKIAKTFDVPCKLIEASAALEASLAENTIRVAMHPADQFIAFRDMVKSGLSIDEVAARFGVTTLFVRQRLKLANVAPRFIEDYRAGALQLEQLEALAVTDDHAAQERVWDSAQNWERSPHNLRRLLTEKKVSSSDKRAIFVGVKTYSDAGGVIEQDLFDDENEGYLTDPALLERLVGDCCEKIVADLLAQGWAWAKPHLENNYWEVLDKYKRLNPVTVSLSKDLVEEEEKLQTALDAIDDDGSADSEKRISQIQARLEEIEEAQTEFTPEQKAKSGVIFAIDHDGRPSYHYGLVERRFKATKDSDGEGQTPESAPEEDSGYSAALLEDLTVQRTAALRAELAGKPDVAMEEKMVGQGSQYAWTATDSSNAPLDGGKSYKLHLPPHIPVKDFWSVLCYSDQTRSMIQTDQQFPSVSGQTKGLLVNDDGSVDVYFGPKAPPGKEMNWVQTVPGQTWFTMLRLYGPLQPWFDMTWRPGEIEPQP